MQRSNSLCRVQHMNDALNKLIAQEEGKLALFKEQVRACEARLTQLRKMAVQEEILDRWSVQAGEVPYWQTQRMGARDAPLYEFPCVNKLDPCHSRPTIQGALRKSEAGKLSAFFNVARCDFETGLTEPNPDFVKFHNSSMKLSEMGPDPLSYDVVTNKFDFLTNKVFCNSPSEPASLLASRPRRRPNDVVIKILGYIKTPRTLEELMSLLREDGIEMASGAVSNVLYSYKTKHNFIEMTSDARHVLTYAGLSYLFETESNQDGKTPGAVAAAPGANSTQVRHLTQSKGD